MFLFKIKKNISKQEIFLTFQKQDYRLKGLYE